MKGIRKFVGLAAIAAVLNPLCCCFAEVIAAALPEKESAHSCCAQPQGGQAQQKAPDGGCGSDSGCPHKRLADEREVPAASHAVAASQPAPAFVAAQLDFVLTSTAAAPKWERGEQRPPGRHDPPAFLRSHSFLN